MVTVALLFMSSGVVNIFSFLSSFLCPPPPHPPSPSSLPSPSLTPHPPPLTLPSSLSLTLPHPSLTLPHSPSLSLSSQVIKGSSRLFTALLDRCLAREVIAICRYIPRRNAAPYFVALVPQVMIIHSNIEAQITVWLLKEENTEGKRGTTRNKHVPQKLQYIYTVHTLLGESTCYMYILYTMYVHIHVHHKQAEPR